MSGRRPRATSVGRQPTTASPPRGATGATGASAATSEATGDELPPGARRLFLDLPAPVPGSHPATVALRLLEEGDRNDLAWLTGRLGEAELGRLVAARGGRALSRRSRAFWSLLLAVEPAPEPPLRDALWPL